MSKSNAYLIRTKLLYYCIQTSAWHAYLSTHVPKMLSFTSPLTVLGMALEVATPSPRYTIIIVIVVHTAIMSLLGHKETRFVLYLAPLFNLLSARAVVFLWQRRRFRYLARACIFLCLSATALTTAVSLRASVGNYPGGEAMQYLHRQKQYVQNGECKSATLYFNTSLTISVQPLSTSMCYLP